MLHTFQLPDIAFGEDENDYLKRMIASYREDYSMTEILRVGKLRYRQEEVRRVVEALQNSDFGTAHFKVNMRDAVVMLLRKVYEL